MKKTLEALLAAAALALGAYVVRQALSRREPAADPSAANPVSAPGDDAENPGAPSARPRRGVESLPMIKLSRPPKPPRHAAVVPPPPVLAP